MKRFLAVIATLAIAVTTALAMPVTGRAASKGYKSTIKLVNTIDNSETTVYSDTKSEIKPADGFMYDKELNTLYISNVTMPDSVIKTENMGELRVIFWGENSFAGLESKGGKFSKTKVTASLLLSGAGSVVIDGKNIAANGIKIEANKTDSIYKCGKYLGLTIKGVTDSAVSVDGSTSKKPIVYCTKGLTVDSGAKEISVTGAACKHTYTIIGDVETPSDQFTKGKATMVCELCGATKVKNIPRIAKIRLSAYGFKYDGKAKKPGIEVINENDKPISTKYYTVSYKDNVNKTTKYKLAKVIVTFKGPYTGKITKYFAIG